MSMRIDFFAEFPEEGELQKANEVDFPCTVWIAADSYEEYLDYKKELNQANSEVQSAYWPIVENSYYISPFASSEDVDEYFSELGKIEDEKILVDVERPFYNRWLYLKNFMDFFRNRKSIRNFLGDRNDGKLEVMTAEFPGVPYFNWFRRLLGTSYSIQRLGHERCPMYHTSMMSSLKISLAKKSLRQKAGSEDMAVGLGTIATGMEGDEPILPPEGLERDLKFLKEIGVQHAVIFRLGGIDEEYLQVLEQFSG